MKWGGKRTKTKKKNPTHVKLKRVMFKCSLSPQAFHLSLYPLCTRILMILLKCVRKVCSARRVSFSQIDFSLVEGETEPESFLIKFKHVLARSNKNNKIVINT